MNISLTGNPFVDTGLAVLATLSDCDSIDDLTLNQLRKIHGDGKQLARWNSKLKSTSMIFTINSLATHPGIKDQNKRILFYSKMITGILNKIGKEDVQEPCESCGNPSSLDIDKLARETLVPLGSKDMKRYIGRDWFPLAGSIGSDAQALPASSRAPNICAKCLFAVHYLPLGVLLINGRLAVFQSTSKSFWYDYVYAIVKEVHRRISAGDRETLGAKEGSIAAVNKILDVMKEMRDEDVPPGTSLFVWQFSNSGTGPDCKIEEIPNSALTFLHEAVSHGCRNEIATVIAKDRSPEHSFLNCISNGSDYSALYPFKKFNGVSPKLFFLYQTRIRSISAVSLNVAYKIAKYIKSKMDKKDFESIGKDLHKDFGKQNAVRKLIVNMVESKALSFAEYMALFSASLDTGKINYDAWKFIRYYMHNTEEAEFDNYKTTKLDKAEDTTSFYVAARIFNLIKEQKGVDKLRETLLMPLAHGKLGLPWLRRQFTKCAEKYEGFTYDDWKSLCLDEQGKESIFEILFRFRLMWTEWIQNQIIPVVSHPPPSTKESIQLETDLSSEHMALLSEIMDSYIARRGTEKFHKHILSQLVTGDKDLYWFRQQFSLLKKEFVDSDYWANFVSDPNGNSIRSLRLFQLHLYLANRYREQTFKQQLQLVPK